MAPRFFILLSFCLLSFSLQAQPAVTGQVIDAISKKSIPFATITGTDNSGGTYSGNDGSFSLLVQGDSLLITSLGYDDLRTVAGPDGAIYQLQPKAYLTNQVTISDSRRLRKKTFGNPDRSNVSYSGWWGTVVARHVGKEFAGEGFLRNATFRIYKHGSACQIFARVRVYANDNGQPGKDLLDKTVLVKIRGGKSKYEVDLRAEQITFPPGGLFIGIEFMQPSNECQDLPNDKKRFYVMTEVKSTPLTWSQLGYGKGEWKVFHNGRNSDVSNANFGVEIGY